MTVFDNFVFCFVILLAGKINEKRVVGLEEQVSPDLECQLTPVIHVLTHSDCKPKAIPSFSCIGTCSSYVQVSGSKIWQMERSCNCCQESGETEATVVLNCPDAKNEQKTFRQVSTKAPLDCMCRPCGSVDNSSINYSPEIASYTEEGPLHN